MTTRDNPPDPSVRRAGAEPAARRVGTEPVTHRAGAAPPGEAESRGAAAAGGTEARGAAAPGGGEHVGDRGEPSLGDLVGQLGEDLSRLMRAELALAKAEVKEDATRAARGAGMLAGAGVAGHLMLAFASLALTFGLGAWMPLGWAALIVAVLWAVVTAALASTGRSQLRRVPPPMDETMETVKEDARWARKPHG